MNNIQHKRQKAMRRANRVRSSIRVSSEKPRLSVHVSNLHVTAQIIDDTNGKTLAYASTISITKDSMANKTELAGQIGKEIAQKAKKAKITRVSFDRGARLYHGRIDALANAAREGGLEF